jgi:branched-chain amino acid transport system permease protein
VSAVVGFLGRRAGAIAIIALLGTILVFPVISDNRYYQTIIILSLLLAIMASGWNIISGFAGYVSLGQTVFLGIGAYTTAILSLRVFGPDEFGQGGANPFYFIPISAIVAGLFAASIGPIIMRTRGHTFVILTIAFLFMMQLIALNWTELTYGNRGLSLPLPDWPREWGNLPFYYIFFGLLLLSVATAWWIRRTKFGMGLIAIREDEDKAAAVGVNTPIYKALAYVASAVWIGAAGGVYAYYLSFIDPRNQFDIVYSVFVVLAVLLGGR